MLPTTKDPAGAVGSVLETAPHPNPGGADSTEQMQRRTDAIGTEIPVVVHASRYSSAAAGVGKNSKPVHEETRTVIVFPNGAVVRVSASMAAGELVVLTNQQTGADVICRVVNVKTQPGIQNYVNLEFTQRAPGFWEANSPSEKNNHAESLRPAPTSLADSMALAEARSPLPQPAMQNSRFIEPHPRTAADPSPVPVSGLTVEQPRSSAFLTGSLLGTDSKSSEKRQTSSAGAVRTSGVGTTNELSGSKKTLLIVGAAVLLLTLGAAGGSWLFRNNRPSGSATQATTNAQEQSIPLPTVTTDQDAAFPPPQIATNDSAPLQSAVGAQSSVPTAQPAAASAPEEQPITGPNVQRDIQARGRPQNTPAQQTQHPSIEVDKLPVPIAKTPSVRDSVEAPIVAVGQSSNLTGSIGLGGGIPSDAPRISAPVVPSRVGGQIVSAKPLASPAPVYPTAAFNKHIEGVVMIDAELDNTGRVGLMTVISGPPELQTAALNALRKWKYQPAMLDGLAVSSHTQVNISFRLPSPSVSGLR